MTKLLVLIIHKMARMKKNKKSIVTVTFNLLLVEGYNIMEAMLASAPRATRIKKAVSTWKIPKKLANVGDINATKVVGICPSKARNATARMT